MHIRHTSIFSIATLLSFGLTATTAIPQTKPNTTNPPEESSPVIAKTIPQINCTDPDSAKACGSFRQLVDAHDAGLLESAFGIGASGHAQHMSYVCFRPHMDNFEVLSIPVPELYAYLPFSQSEIPEDVIFAFPNRPGEPTVRASTKARWLNDHSDSSLYRSGYIVLASYQDGVKMGYRIDFGKWSLEKAAFCSDLLLLQTSDQLVNCDGYKPSQTPVLERGTFEGANFWLQSFNDTHNRELAREDNPEAAHIKLDDAAVYVNYSYTSKVGKTTQYVLNIQRSTGRFTETFTPLNMEAFSDSGTCMIFKE
jgi:hypothetical protein